MAYTQESRLLAVSTPLGDDVLLLTSFMGSEAISQLFHFELEMVSEQESISFDSMIGKNVTMRVRLSDGSDRYFNGFCSRFSQGGRDHDFTYYRAEIVPWLWFLTRIADCRIFQDKTVPEIVEQIFKDNGFQDYSLKLYRQCTAREYCVQYRETDFHFISRLMEEEGIFYFFKHENGKHTMVLADAPTAHEECPKQESARYEITTGGWQDDDVITEFRVEHELRSSKYSQRDFNFETPSNHLEAVVGDQNLNIYDFQQGQYKVRGDGDALTRIRLQEAQAPAVIGYGVSDCRAFSSGCKFTLKEHYRDDLNQAYVLISIQHSARQGGNYRSGDDSEFLYTNSFECLPLATPYRPPRTTPRPLVHGAETAIVTGPGGEEIYTDKHGRVKVQFHWDRDGKMDEHTSCWIRVAQLWAGKGWGAMYIPRTGQEVIVEFLQGNPDQPIITGRVYNGEQPPPYPLPAQQTKSTIKSLSSKGGGGFNEFRFEDKKGEEQVFLHAERNLDIRVKKDEYKTVEKELHLVVENDHFEHSKTKRHQIVDSDMVVKLGADHHLNITGKQAIKVGGSHSFQVTGNVGESFSMSHSEQVGMAYYLKAMNIVIEADMGITLKCGSNAVVIDPVGVTLQGNLVVINGTMTLINSGPGSPAMSGQANSLVSPTDAKAAEDADKADPGEMAQIKADQVQRQAGKYGAVKLPPYKPGAGSTGEAGMVDPDQPAKPKHWIEIVLKDEDGNPIPGELYRIVLPDGTVDERTLDDKGYARYDGIDPGTCKVTFPNLDKKIWHKA